MNREIKFRGKAVDDGEWLIGDIVHIDSNNKSVSNMQIKPFDHGGAYAVDKSTVGQFTGLTDKNGKEIFEGDILLRDRCVENPCIVEFENGGFKIHDRNVYSPLSAIIQFSYIIGNIHDNPELIKTK